MSVIRVLVLLACATLALPAFAQQHKGAIGNKVKWHGAVQAEVGGMLVNSAAGGHPLRLYGGVRAAYRPAFLFTFTGGYGLTYIKEGPSEVTYTNLNHRLFGRLDLSWGTVNRQFYIGAGPGLFLNQFTVTDGSNDYNGLLLGPGLVYALGFRISLAGGRLPVAMEFGGQYHHERQDFTTTLVLGVALF